MPLYPCRPFETLILLTKMQPKVTHILTTPLWNSHPFIKFTYSISLHMKANKWRIWRRNISCHFPYPIYDVIQTFTHLCNIYTWRDLTAILTLPVTIHRNGYENDGLTSSKHANNTHISPCLKASISCYTRTRTHVSDSKRCQR